MLLHPDAGEEGVENRSCDTGDGGGGDVEGAPRKRISEEISDL